MLFYSVFSFNTCLGARELFLSLNIKTFMIDCSSILESLSVYREAERLQERPVKIPIWVKKKSLSDLVTFKVLDF